MPRADDPPPAEEDRVSEYVNADDLDALGFTAADVRARCPWATEYVALDGGRYWMLDDLTEWLGDTGNDANAEKRRGIRTPRSPSTSLVGSRVLRQPPKYPWPKPWPAKRKMTPT